MPQPTQFQEIDYFPGPGDIARLLCEASQHNQHLWEQAMKEERHEVWLEQEDKSWVYSVDLQRILEHTGRMIDCVEGIEYEELIATKTGHPNVLLSGNRMLLVDFPVAEDMEELTQRAKNGEILAITHPPFYLRGTFKGVEYRFPDKTQVVYDGCITRQHESNNYSLFMYDPKKLASLRRSKRAKEAHQAKNATVTKQDFENVVRKISARLNVDHPKGFRVCHTIVWLLACDTALTEKITNKCIGNVAKRWMLKPEKYRKTYIQWCSNSIITRLHNRLKKAAGA